MGIYLEERPEDSDFLTKLPDDFDFIAAAERMGETLRMIRQEKELTHIDILLATQSALGAPTEITSTTVMLNIIRHLGGFWDPLTIMTCLQKRRASMSEKTTTTAEITEKSEV